MIVKVDGLSGMNAWSWKISEYIWTPLKIQAWTKRLYVHFRVTTDTTGISCPSWQRNRTGRQFEPCTYRRMRLHAGGSLVVWHGMMFPNSSGIEAEPPPFHFTQWRKLIIPRQADSLNGYQIPYVLYTVEANLRDLNRRRGGRMKRRQAPRLRWDGGPALA